MPGLLYMQSHTTADSTGPMFNKNFLITERVKSSKIPKCNKIKGSKNKNGIFFPSKLLAVSFLSFFLLSSRF